MLFCLSRSGIRCEGAKAIAETLKTNTTLVKLNLEENVSTQKNTLAFKHFTTNNEINNEGVKAIGEALKTNTTLVRFDLR